MISLLTVLDEHKMKSGFRVCWSPTLIAPPSLEQWYIEKPLVPKHKTENWTHFLPKNLC